MQHPYLCCILYFGTTPLWSGRALEEHDLLAPERLIVLSGSDDIGSYAARRVPESAGSTARMKPSAENYSKQ